MYNLWTPKDQRLLEWLKQYIVSGHTLVRPEPYKRLYINIYWSNEGMG